MRMDSNTAENIRLNLAKFRQFCDEGTLYKQELDQIELDQDVNKSVTLEEIKPRVQKQKNVYKKRKLKVDVPKIKSMLDNSMNESMDSLESIEVEEPGHELVSKFTMHSQRIIDAIYLGIICRIDQLKVLKCLRLTQICSIKLGINQSKDLEDDLILAQYKPFLRLGFILRDIIGNRVLADEIIPKVTVYCYGAKVPIYEMVLDKLIQSYDTTDFWNNIEMIESLGTQLNIDARSHIISHCIEHIKSPDDNQIESLYDLIDSQSHTNHIQCLEVLAIIIQTQSNSLNNPKNFKSSLQNLQKEHIIILNTLSYFIKITPTITNKSIRFIQIVQRILLNDKHFQGIMTLLKAFFKRDKTYKHHAGLSHDDSFIIRKIFSNDYKLTASFIKFINKINIKTNIFPIDHVTNLVSPKPRLKRSKISTGDLI